jgi:hypothetical protein
MVMQMKLSVKSLKYCSELLVSFPRHNHYYITSTSLQGISESLKTLNDLASSVRALVRPPELEVHEQCNNHDQSSSDHARSDTRHIVRSILSAEDGASNDTTDTSCTDKGSGAESALPLATDVVRLPGKNAWNVGISSRSSEEHAEVSISR